MRATDAARRTRRRHETRDDVSHDKASLLSLVVDARSDGSNSEDEVAQTAQSRRQPAIQLEIEDINVRAHCALRGHFREAMRAAAHFAVSYCPASSCPAS
eukprot:3761919-Prymnesium_polylepis.1